MSSRTTIAATAVVLLTTQSAFAQDAAPTPPATPPAAPATVAAPAAKEGAGESDHDKFVGHLGVGYFGVSQLPIAAGGGPGVPPAAGTVNAPVVGVRYWLQRNLGIDAGLGFGWTTGSQEVVQNNISTSTDKPSSFGMAFHGGVPIAIAHASHYTFEIVPEALVGFTTGTIKGAPGTSDQNLSGFRLDVGARAGAEIHFGFIGIPELALEASVGLYFRRDAFKWSQGNNSSSDGTTTLTTSVQSDPWAIFVNNISALYYF